MNTQTQKKKLELIQWLATLEDSAIINKLLKFRDKEVKDWWDSISEDETKSIEAGLRDAESGKLNNHSSARVLYEKWL